MMDGMPLVGFAEHVAKRSHADAVRGSASYGNATPSGGVENIFEKAIPLVAGSANVQKHLNEGIFSLVLVSGWLISFSLFLCSYPQLSKTLPSLSKLTPLKCRVSRAMVVISSRKLGFLLMHMFKWPCSLPPIVCGESREEPTKLHRPGLSYTEELKQPVLSHQPPPHFAKSWAWYPSTMSMWKAIASRNCKPCKMLSLRIPRTWARLRRDKVSTVTSWDFPCAQKRAKAYQPYTRILFSSGAKDGASVPVT